MTDPIQSRPFHPSQLHSCERCVFGTGEHHSECQKVTTPGIRPNGYYWVRTKYDGWMPAQWNDVEWCVAGWEEAREDEYFAEIGPQLVPPKTQ